MTRKKPEKIADLDMGLIDEPRGRVRLEIDPQEVKELADSIAEVGLLQPIVVRGVDSRFEIVAGHRRFLACQLLGFSRIKALVRELDDTQTAFVRATENLRRVDLTPIEEAAIYADLRDNFGVSEEAIGKRMGVSPGVVKRRLDLLKMPPNLQQAIHKKQISYGVAEELWRITEVKMRDYYLGFAIDHGITVAVARGWVDDWKKSQRRVDSDVGPGGPPANPLEERPYYLTCEICFGPTKIQEAKNVTMCVGCLAQIQNALKGQQ